ncbi:MAG: universal stress protein [Acidimicrobiales bacterium]
MSECPFTSVAVGVDGSVAAGRAVAWAAERIRPGGTIELVYGSPDAAKRSSASAHLEDDWSETARKAGIDLRCTTSAEEPPVAVMKLADEVGADAVVVGAHGAGGAGRRSPFLGSVTRKLLIGSQRPLIVHNEVQSASDAGRVVGCVGYGPAAQAAAAWAAWYAATTNRKLELLHAVSNRPIFPIDAAMDVLGSYLGPGVDMSWASEDLAAFGDELVADHPGLVVAPTVVRGSAVKAITEAGRGLEPDDAAELVVIGRGAMPISSPLPRTPRLHRVIARSSCPVAVVPCRSDVQE